MNLATKKFLAFAAGALWTFGWGAPARADDIELFVGSGTPAVQARPNILLILDDSGSMGATLTTLKGIGHSMNLERADEFNAAVLDWLSANA